KKSDLRSRASITASTLSDFNRAWAIALVCLGCERETSCPNSLAFSTNHHHEPVASTAIFVPLGSFFKTPSTVFGSLEKRNWDGGCPSLRTANCVTRLCRSAPAKFSIEWLLSSRYCHIPYDKTAREAIPFMRSIQFNPNTICSFDDAYRMIVVARANRSGGIVRPMCFAVCRLITNSNFAGCWTGRSAGLAPFRILSTYQDTSRMFSARSAP